MSNSPNIDCSSTDRWSNDGQLWLILITTSLAGFLLAIDTTLINFALPPLQRDLGITIEQGSWVINSFSMAYLSLVILGGRICDIWGRRRVFIIGCLVFGLGSLICASGGTIQIVLLGRVVQATGSALMMPGSIAIVTDAFQHKDLGLAIGIWGAIAALGLIVGPLISGSLIAIFGWRSVFVLAAVLSAVILIMTISIVQESKDENANRDIDWIGGVLAGTSVLLIVFALWNIDSNLWKSVGLFALSIIGITFFIITEKRRKNPLIDLVLFRNRVFLTGIIIRFTSGFGFVPVVLLSTIYMQNFLHRTAFEAGIMFLPIGLLVVISTLMWGRVIGKFGPKMPLIFGTSLLVISTLIWVNFDASSNYVELLMSLSLAAIGGGCAFVATTILVMNSLGTHKAGLGSGILNMIQNVSGSIGVALVSMIFANSLRKGLEEKAPMADFSVVANIGPEIGSLAQAEVFAKALSNAGIPIMIMVIVGLVWALILPRKINVRKVIYDDL